MKAANFVGVKSDNRKTNVTHTPNKSRNQYNLPVTRSTQGGGQKWASDTNKKPKTLSVIRSVWSANYWPLTLCQNCLSVVT